MQKGTLKIVTGDATQPQKSAENEIVMIPHCCNNIGAWGAGFVLALSKRWKLPEQTYKSFCENNKDNNILGEVCFAKIDNYLVVANMIGQNGVVSSKNPKPIKYSALIEAMKKVSGYIKMIENQVSNPVVIHCPKFGSDLAGGSWELIEELINEIWIENGHNVVVYEYIRKDFVWE